MIFASVPDPLRNHRSQKTGLRRFWMQHRWRDRLRRHQQRSEAKERLCTASVLRTQGILYVKLPCSEPKVFYMYSLLVQNLRSICATSMLRIQGILQCVYVKLPCSEPKVVYSIFCAQNLRYSILSSVLRT